MASTILSHFSLRRLAIMKSVNTSAFCAILNAATVATPPAPIIRILLIVIMYFLLIIYFISPYAQCRHEGIAEDFLTEVAGREWLHGKDGGADVVGSVAQRAFHAVVVNLGIGY